MLKYKKIKYFVNYILSIVTTQCKKAAVCNALLQKEYL